MLGFMSFTCPSMKTTSGRTGALSLKASAQFSFVILKKSAWIVMGVSPPHVEQTL
jgi:hypothetical protein